MTEMTDAQLENVEREIRGLVTNWGGEKKEVSYCEYSKAEHRVRFHCIHSTSPER